MAESGSGAGRRPDRRRTRSIEVATYLGGIAALIQVSTFFDQWRLPPWVSVVLVAVIIGSVAIAFGWSLLTHRRPSTLAIAVSAAGVAAVLGAWLGPFAPTSDGEENGRESGPDGPTGSPTSSDQQPSPTPVGNNLCATPPEAPSQTWFLYEDAATDRQIVVEQDGRPATSIPGAAFAAAGEHVVYADLTEREQVELMSLDTGELIGSTTLDGRVTDTTMSEDAETIVLLEDLAGDNRLTLWRPNDDELTVLHDPHATLSSPALSPSADRLAWIEGPPPGRLIIADFPELAQQHELAGAARDPAWSPDGSTVVYSAGFGDGQAIYATPGEGGEQWRLSTPVQQTDYDPVVTPTCDGVVYVRSQDGTVDLWQTHMDGDDEPLSELAGAQSRPAFATD